MLPNVKIGQPNSTKKHLTPPRPGSFSALQISVIGMLPRSLMLIELSLQDMQREGHFTGAGGHGCGGRR